MITWEEILNATPYPGEEPIFTRLERDLLVEKGKVVYSVPNAFAFIKYLKKFNYKII